MKQYKVFYYSEFIHWFFNDKFHRDKDLPARYYLRSRNLYSVVYCQHGLDHRTTGPAIINYKDKIKKYYYQDRKYDSLEEMLMVEACR